MGGPFVWHELNAGHLLPRGWEDAIISLARRRAFDKTIIPTSVTSREANIHMRLPVQTCGGRAIQEELPWLFDLYKGDFRALGARFVTEPLLCANDVRYAINLNIQQGASVRYECHVDSNPLEGLLYVTSHPPGTGGELVVARNPGARNVAEVDQDCVRIYPTAGRLLFFDAREHAHYVSALNTAESLRVVVAMNFYTPSCPESARPKDLDRHLGLMTAI